VNLSPRSNQHPADENLIAAIALGKTIAFLFYSIASVMLTVAISEFYIKPNFPNSDRDTAIYEVFTALELVLLYLVVRGVLPATDGARAEAFTERQAEWGIAVLSFVPWLFYTDPNWFAVYMWSINGALFLVAAVYFITKSALSRSPRIEVLGILLVPSAHLLAERLIDS
jgi:hypothetical protein